MRSNSSSCLSDLMFKEGVCKYVTRQLINYRHVLHEMYTETSTLACKNIQGFCQINGYSLLTVNKCFREFPKCCRIAACVFECVSVCVQRLTGLVGQPVTTKTAKHSASRREINFWSARVETRVSSSSEHVIILGCFCKDAGILHFCVDPW